MKKPKEQNRDFCQKEIDKAYREGWIKGMFDAAVIAAGIPTALGVSDSILEAMIKKK